MQKVKIGRSHCNSCGRVTAQEVISHRVVEDHDDGYWWTNTYDTLECRGCKTVSLRHHYVDAADDQETVLYPPPISRRSPAWSWSLPIDMREMLDEIYRALHNGSSRLALMGARTLVDLLLTSHVGDVGSFRQKLAALRNRDVITARHAQVLEVALDAGSAAAHRAFKPEAEDLNAVMDIIENLFQSIYHLDRVANRLKKNTPQRP